MNLIKTKIFKKSFICILIILSFGAAGFGLWNAGTFLPHWIVWKSAVFQDASGQYEMILEGKKMRVLYEDNLIWNAPKDVKVQKALSADIDRDGQDELVLLCWRKGRYGDVKPIWEKEDAKDWLQHIFVYELMQDGVHAKWMSSYIGKDILDITAHTSEESGNLLHLTDRSGEESMWRWESWGFKRVDKP